MEQERHRPARISWSAPKTVASWKVLLDQTDIGGSFEHLIGSVQGAVAAP
jgi:hypothetical protein